MQQRVNLGTAHEQRCAVGWALRAKMFVQGLEVFK